MNTVDDFKVGDCVEFYSDIRKCWISGVVVKHNPIGANPQVPYAVEGDGVMAWVGGDTIRKISEESRKELIEKLKANLLAGQKLLNSLAGGEKEEG
jgi:hypothetical protein